MADYKGRIGNLIRDARKHRGLTQHQLAELLGTSQSAINRIEKGHQNLSLEMLARIGAALDSEIVALGAGPTHLRVDGPTTLSGSIDVKTSKNAGVALLCASLLNKGRTTLRKVARIEEVNRLLEVLNSLGVATRWVGDENDLEIIPPAELDLSQIDEARRAAHPLGDHVPRPAAAPRRRVRAPLRRRLQPRRAHRRAAHVGPAALRPRGQGHRRRLPRERQPDHRADAPDRAHRARRLRHRERAHGRRAAPGHHGHPQRLVQLHGPGPLLLPAEARRRRRGHRHHHPARSPASRRSTSTSTTPRPRTRSRRCRCSRPPS